MRRARIAAALLAAALAPGLAPTARAADEACLDCHADRAPAFAESVHAALGCESCHAGHETFPHPADPVPAACADCHPDVIAEWERSVHFEAAARGDGAAPRCASCHGGVHEIRSREDAASPVAAARVADTCAGCHASPEFLALHSLGYARPIEAWRSSVHGRAVARGDAAATCPDCHGSHAILRGGDAQSSIHASRVPDTCGACHPSIRDAYLGSVHGRAAARGVRSAPVCTDCHGEHAILAPSEPGSLVNPVKVSSLTCGQCHANERLLARFNLPADRVPTFRDSFHGLSARSGRQTVANCASCHGVHDIRPASDPASKVHPANLATTCGACHPGASTRYALGPVHVSAGGASEHPAVRFIRIAYLFFIIPITLGFMVVHNFIDLAAKAMRGVTRRAGGAELPRMNRGFRIAHWGVMASFVALVLSGFALKYPESWWAAPFLRFEAQLPLRGWIHRGAAVILLGAVLFHALHLALRRRDRVILRDLVPTRQDARDVLQMLRYNLGRSEHRPHFGRFSYGEKLEYLAFAWGTVLMSVTGFLLWFESWALRHLPLWTLDASTVLHWYEAILATLSILIWHLYAVVFDPEVYPMDRSWLTGRTSAEHLRRTRPAYFDEVTRGTAQEARPAPTGSESSRDDAGG
jgi:formate dehydrogenase gamma subunit